MALMMAPPARSEAEIAWDHEPELAAERFLASALALTQHPVSVSLPAVQVLDGDFRRPTSASAGAESAAAVSSSSAPPFQPTAAGS